MTSYFSHLQAFVTGNNSLIVFFLYSSSEDITIPLLSVAYTTDLTNTFVDIATAPEGTVVWNKTTLFQDTDSGLTYQSLTFTNLPSNTKSIFLKPSDGTTLGDSTADVDTNLSLYNVATNGEFLYVLTNNTHLYAPFLNIVTSVVTDSTFTNTSNNMDELAGSTSLVYVDASRLITTTFNGNIIFDGCTSLETVTFPVTDTGMSNHTISFQDCNLLTNVNGYLVTTVPNSNYLLQITLSNTQLYSTTAPFPDLFKNLLVDITLDNTVTTLQDGTFDSYNNLKTVTLNACTQIGSYVFSQCSSLQSLLFTQPTIPVAYVSSIDNTSSTSVFSNITDPFTINGFTVKLNSISNLLTLTFSDDTMNQSNIASFLPLVQNLEIKDNFTTLTTNAFAGATNLETVTIYPYNKDGKSENMLTTLGAYAFADCTSLTNVYSSLDKYRKDLNDWNVEINENFSFSGNVFDLSGLSKLESVGDGCFQGCTKLESFFLNRKYVDFGNGVFSGCLDLNRIGYIIDGGLPFPFIFNITGLDTNGNLQLTVDMNSIRYFPQDSIIVEPFLGALGAVVIDSRKIDGGCTLPDFFFANAVHLTEVEFLGNSLYSIGKNCFMFCSFITSLDLQPLGGLQNIYENAFLGCSSLQQVMIPSGNLIGFGINAFSGCSSLTKLNTLDVRVEERAIDGLSAGLGWTYNSDASEDDVRMIRNGNNKHIISSLVIDSSIKRIGKSMFDGFSNITSITFPTSPLNIESFAFTETQSLNSLVIPSNVIIESEYNLCTYCLSLRSVVLNATGSIGNGNFFGCTALTDVSFGDTQYTTIEGQCFYGCLSLKQITLPSSITNLNGECFALSGLTSIDLSGTKITYFGSGIFSYCASLTTITLPENLNTVENSVFYGCYALTNVILSSKLPLFSSIDWTQYPSTFPFDIDSTTGGDDYNTFLTALSINETRPTFTITS
jgi:BspA type Leucine rich repeat region (6 copies)